MDLKTPVGASVGRLAVSDGQESGGAPAGQAIDSRLGVV
jgi:hypothetical protein